MRHTIRGLLIGPLVAPVAYWIGVMLFVRRSARGLDWYPALRELGVIVTFGLPVAYAATLRRAVPGDHAAVRRRRPRCIGRSDVLEDGAMSQFARQLNRTGLAMLVAT